MYKLLIVDDEILALNYIASFSCIRELGFEIVGKAKNGEQGMQLFLEHRPDVVITDIKMPVEDGMSMIHKILQVTKKVQIYILTAYSDFEYAKQALDLGINGYILKHELENDKIREILEKVVLVLEKQLEIEQMERHFTLQDIIMNGKEESLREKISLFKNKYYLPMILHRTVQMDLKSGEMKQVVGDGIYSYLKSVITALGGSYEDILFTEMNELDYMVLVGIDNGSSLYVMERYLQEIYHEFYKRINGMNGLGTIVYALQAYDVRRLNSFYETYCKGKRNIFCYQNAGLLDIKTIDKTYERDLSFDKKITKIEVYLKEQDFLTAKTVSLQLLSQLRDLSCGGMVLISAVTRLFHVLVVFRSKMMGNMESFLPVENCMKVIADNAEEAIQITEHLLELVEKEYEVNRYSSKISFILQYIQKNYRNDIAIEDLADALEISTVYVSRLFKKEVGINFVEYLTKYRIEQSKILLDTTSMKILEIADCVGYRSSQYYSSMFKKYVGMSPYEYRERKK